MISEIWNKIVEFFTPKSVSDFIEEYNKLGGALKCSKIVLCVCATRHISHPIYGYELFFYDGTVMTITDRHATIDRSDLSNKTVYRSTVKTRRMMRIVNSDIERYELWVTTRRINLDKP